MEVIALGLLVLLLVAIWTQAASKQQAGAAASFTAQVFAPAPTYRPQTREVSNWRWQAAVRLDAPLSFGAAVLAGRVPASVSRCVKLNNYWCIKRAGWAGEIAADSEGHVAFTSALEGARTAALLLRRYYIDFGRHTAMEIVSHWAPAQCGSSIGAFAVHGLGNTLRARWLAAHRSGARIRLRSSVIASRPIIMMRTPTIEAGVSEVPLAPINMASLLDVRLPKIDTHVPAAGCADESQRIASYAVQAAKNIAKTDEDLRLFDANGRSTPNLYQLLANMAGVEIGPLHPRSTLIEAAIAKIDESAGVKP
jgi:hypothetical protein